jgi:hypothetical protein
MAEELELVSYITEENRRRKYLLKEMFRKYTTNCF